MESSHPPEGTESHADNVAADCGWRVLPEAPVASSEGAGFYLQLCCQCVPPATGGGGSSDDVVITCAEYSSKFGMYVHAHMHNVYTQILSVIHI